jgi:ribosomal protein RSM22 (predicted rRNA methylase)
MLMPGLNATVSSSIHDAIHALIAQEGLSLKKVAESVGELSRLFTKERGHLNRTYLDDRLLGTAYLQYFLPVNLAKIQVLLKEMPAPEVGERFSVLDLGSGPGTGALAALDWWHQEKLSGELSIVAIDHTATALRQAQQLWDEYCRSATITTASLQVFKLDVERGPWVEQARPKAPFDLIIVANCLNELSGSTEVRAGLIVSALPLLAPHGTMMIVEPALRETSRALHQVRDRLLQEKHCTVFSPCLHENGCPALVKLDDWCHEERAWEAPAVIKKIDEEVGFIKDALKFSYLMLRKDGKTIIDRRPDVYRVVSELREMKGEKRAWLCNEQGRQEVGRQDRLASAQNQAFNQWHRGAIVQLDRIVRKERGGKVSGLGRIEQDATVRIVRST